MPGKKREEDDHALQGSLSLARVLKAEPDLGAAGGGCAVAAEGEADSIGLQGPFRALPRWLGPGAVQ